MVKTRQERNLEAEMRASIYKERSPKQQMELVCARPGQSAKESKILSFELQKLEFGGIIKESKPAVKKKKVHKKGVSKPKVRGVQKKKRR